MEMLDEIMIGSYGSFTDGFKIILIHHAMGTHVSFIFRGYKPCIGVVKPSFFHGFGVQGWMV